MTFHWIPLNPGNLKINVHGAHPAIPVENGNNNTTEVMHHKSNASRFLFLRNFLFHFKKSPRFPNLLTNFGNQYN
ncbi:hypothetical protein ACET3Z_006156 [Daucus carota]